jgi:hypothetical protein
LSFKDSDGGLSKPASANGQGGGVLFRQPVFWKQPWRKLPIGSDPTYEDADPATALNVFGDGTANNPATIDAIRASYYDMSRYAVWSTKPLTPNARTQGLRGDGGRRLDVAGATSRRKHLGHHRPL